MYTKDTLGDYVYFSDANDDILMRFDATLPDPVLETVATGIDSPAGMFFEGDYLYVNGYLSQAVFRIDVTGGFPAPAVEVLALIAFYPSEVGVGCPPCPLPLPCTSGRA